jgi:hypothetical protein
VRRSEERSGGGFFRKSQTPLPPQRVRRRVLFPLLSLAAAPFRPLPNRLFVSLRAVFFLKLLQWSGVCSFIFTKSG